MDSTENLKGYEQVVVTGIEDAVKELKERLDSTATITEKMGCISDFYKKMEKMQENTIQYIDTVHWAEEGDELYTERQMYKVGKEDVDVWAIINKDMSIDLEFGTKYATEETRKLIADMADELLCSHYEAVKAEAKQFFENQKDCDLKADDKGLVLKFKEQKFYIGVEDVISQYQKPDLGKKKESYERD